MIAQHAIELMPNSLVKQVAADKLADVEYGAYAPDTVAYWSDHIGMANPYDATDGTHSHALEFIAGVTDVLATLVLPFDGFTEANAAFLLGCLSHVAADLNQPYHCSGRHAQDHEEHREFETKMQDWAIESAKVPKLGPVTLPGQLRSYLQLITLPRSYHTYRQVLGQPSGWPAIWPEVHARAVHDVLVVWQVVNREVCRRQEVLDRLDKEHIEQAEPLDGVLEGKD